VQQSQVSALQPQVPALQPQVLSALQQSQVTALHSQVPALLSQSQMLRALHSQVPLLKTCCLLQLNLQSKGTSKGAQGTTNQQDRPAPTWHD
jgi:hypothetical protein